MFTGIIEELGVVQSLRQSSHSAQLRISAPLVVSDLKAGDSIAVNGICLTVTAFDSTSFTVDVMPETMQRTNLRELKTGSKVNLERALRLSDRLGGHLVSGHVDGVGTICSRMRQDIAVVLGISFPPELGKYLVPKGSIAIDGTSLTIVTVEARHFSVSLIPHTRGITTLGHKNIGDTVNLEVDLIARYLEKLVTGSGPVKPVAPSSGALSLDFLSQKGFL